MTVSALLEDVGFEVVIAESIAEARVKMKDRSLSMFVLDLHLGGGLSTELVPEIRRDFPNAKIVLLTGTGLADEQTRGVDRLMTKGGDPVELVRSLEEILRI
jgi:two-component system response regulator PilR (NtrC family)